MPDDFSDLTWSCHVCHDERPDAQVSVFTRALPGKLGEWGGTINVRYCNDRDSCVRGASIVADQWVSALR